MRKLILSAMVFLVGCGGGGKVAEAGRHPDSVGDGGVAYPRSFDGELRLTGALDGSDQGRVTWNRDDPFALLGCSETADAGEFVFFLKSGDDALALTFTGAGFRESKTVYTDLVEVILKGQLHGLIFDRQVQAYQVNSCQARVDRVGAQMSGRLECFNVTGIGQTLQLKLDLNFACTVVGR